jgi:hypothetical protein
MDPYFRAAGSRNSVSAVSLLLTQTQHLQPPTTSEMLWRSSSQPSRLKETENTSSNISYGSSKLKIATSLQIPNCMEMHVLKLL